MLNNHGWGMRDMIIYSCIILLFLLIATYYIRTFYKGLSNASNTVVEKNKEEEPIKKQDINLYKNYELRMDTAAINFVYKNYGDLNRSIASINLSDMTSKGYIEPLYDQLDNSLCVGYSNVWDSEDGVLHSSSYVRCTHYKTDGYIG